MSFNRAEYNKAYNKELYKYCKSKGICVRCTKQKAKEGHTMCPDCLDVVSMNHTDYYYEKGRKTPQDSKRRAYYTRRKKDLCEAFGICVKCMKHDATKDKKYCIECLNKKKAQYRERVAKTREVPPKDTWATLNLCRLCGKPVVEGYKVCEKHLAQARHMASKAPNRNKSSHPWKQTIHAEVKEHTK